MRPVFRFPFLLWSSLLVTLFLGAMSARAESLVELTVGKTHFTGRVEGQNKTHCWLMGQDGVLHQIPLKEVTNYHRVSPQFKRWTPLQMKSSLSREFGSDFEVATTAHYITVAPKGTASVYVKLFDNVYRQFYSYFKIRRLELEKPEFPMVAVVLPDERSFIEYCKRDGVRYQPELRGYYQPRTNRVALYLPSNQLTWQKPARLKNGMGVETFLAGTETSFPTIDSLSQSNYYANLASIDEDVRDTIIHEGTHQVAFNMNLHSRLGDNPRWIVEGLATVFESPGIRDSSRVMQDKLNRERYLWFKDYSTTRRPEKSLSDFLVTDDLFNKSSLDAYSEAWALSFYLLETRPRQYVEYLQQVSKQGNGRRYTSQERIADFQQIIHENVAKVEAEYLRFHEKLRR
ncbi:MAG: DUF1570 domain-containing protein [Planctomycetaceae bacterium]|nr:DUF1570 domain-containing protein [Planctomycetaceae bacterium]